MAYCFGAESVYYNAFYAAKGIKRTLSNSEIDVFCEFVRIAVDKGLEQYREPRCCRVSFDFNELEFFEQHPDFVRVHDWVIYSGPEMTSKDIDAINLCLGFGLPLFAFEVARVWFRRWLKDRVSDGFVSGNESELSESASKEPVNA